jgi:hypothetical protein
LPSISHVLPLIDPLWRRRIKLIITPPAARDLFLRQFAALSFAPKALQHVTLA